MNAYRLRTKGEVAGPCVFKAYAFYNRIVRGRQTCAFTGEGSVRAVRHAYRRKGRRKVGGKRYEARSHRRSSPDSLAF